LVVEYRDRATKLALAIGTPAAAARTRGEVKLERTEVHTRGDVAMDA
jgi:hypothetical protein